MIFTITRKKNNNDKRSYRHQCLFIYGDTIIIIKIIITITMIIIIIIIIIIL